MVRRSGRGSRGQGTAGQGRELGVAQGPAPLRPAAPGARRTRARPPRCETLLCAGRRAPSRDRLQETTGGGSLLAHVSQKVLVL